MKPAPRSHRSNPVMESLSGMRAATTAAPAEAAVDPEQAWIDRARQGDAEAFRRLVELHQDRAYGLALRIVRDPSEAEEVAQDAFVRAWRGLPRFRMEARFSTWLYRIVARCAFDRAAALRARRGRETGAEEAEALRTEDPAPRRLEAIATADRLERLMGGLSEAQRMVVTLFYYEDRSVAELARMIRCPENTVKTHLSRARAALRQAWLGDEGEETAP
jgi:RNA polymerase sigma-70 factor, ECF subfamily